MEKRFAGKSTEYYNLENEMLMRQVIRHTKEEVCYHCEKGIAQDIAIYGVITLPNHTQEDLEEFKENDELEISTDDMDFVWIYTSEFDQELSDLAQTVLSGHTSILGDLVIHDVKLTRLQKGVNIVYDDEFDWDNTVTNESEWGSKEDFDNYI